MSQEQLQERIALNGRSLTRRQFIQLSAAGFSAAALAACAPTVAPTTDGGETAASGESAPAADDGGVTGGTIVWVGHQEVSGLSPSDAGPTVHWAMISNIHNALLQVDVNNALIPVLAESYEVAPDGLQYTFTLKQGVPFHDGKEFTSADVKYTYEFYSNAENGSTIANNFRGMGQIETPDDYTVVINMEAINAAFLVNAATTWIVQSEYHAEVGEEVYRTAPIGTGAFKLVEWVPAEYTLLEAFEDHFQGRPRADFLRQNIVPEPSVRTIALETGEADSNTWPLLVEDSLRLSQEGFTMYSTPADSVKHFPLNNELPQLSDKRVRQAMLMALDRQRIIDELWNGAAEIAHANLSPAANYFNPNVKQYSFDPEAAKALLEEAGWTDSDGDGIRENADGLKLSFTCTTITGDQARRPIAELAQQFLKDVGVDMQLAEAPVASILEALPKGEMDCSLFNWTYGSSLDPDASVTLRSDGANNFSRFKNDRVDELLDLGLQTVDPDQRRTYYDEIQEIVAEEVPFLFLQYDQWLNLFHPRVIGIPDPTSTPQGDNIYPFGNIMGLQQG
jgi:peptide/nickel transport system substrate-binding protein